MEYKTVLFEFNDGIGHMIMNRPPSNIMTVEFFMELGLLVEEIKMMTELKALVISGQGRHFSAGAELDELISLVSDENSIKNNDLSDFLSKNLETFMFFEQANFPVISAIKGVCLGSALELALFTHYRFCGEDAVLGLPETTFNLLPGIGGITRIAKLAGKSKALELVLRGNTFPAEEALSLNIVDHILPKKKVIQAAFDFAASIMHDYRKGKEKLHLQKMHI